MSTYADLDSHALTRMHGGIRRQHVAGGRAPHGESSIRAKERTASLLAQLRRPAAPRHYEVDQPPPFLDAAAVSALAVTPPELRLAKIKAAKLTGPQELTIVAGEVPVLENCPPGSILVRARWASICGSDLPSFRQTSPVESRPPNSYWDRDGFCGHEVVGTVIASKSDKFRVGDFALSLPTSYFKSHAGGKQDWYREEIHGVLLEPFPEVETRGAFTEIYTSHELYSWPISNLSQSMVTAQGLGCILRMARKLGWSRDGSPNSQVRGKTVAVVGQGQNGLIAAKVMRMMGAAQVLGIDPIAERRAVSPSMGCTHVATPETWPEVLRSMGARTDRPDGGKGVDFVLEMVGHNQYTIEMAMDLCKPSGTIVCFGVPDEKTYQFPYEKWFRANLTMIASVTPDPGVDFPEAVEMMEAGEFEADILYTHVFKLDDIQKAFEISSSYTDGVIKMIFDVPQPTEEDLLVS